MISRHIYVSYLYQACTRLRLMFFPDSRIRGCSELHNCFKSVYFSGIKRKFDRYIPCLPICLSVYFNRKSIILYFNSCNAYSSFLLSFLSMRISLCLLFLSSPLAASEIYRVVTTSHQ